MTRPRAKSAARSQVPTQFARGRVKDPAYGRIRFRGAKADDLRHHPSATDKDRAILRVTLAGRLRTIRVDVPDPFRSVVLLAFQSRQKRDVQGMALNVGGSLVITEPTGIAKVDGNGPRPNRVRLDICDGIDNGIVANVAALRFECLRRGGV